MAKKGKVNCFEIPATKMDRAQKFYAHFEDTEGNVLGVWGPK
jgi:predicted enzyme related to lactoylglutathione lyase